MKDAYRRTFRCFSFKGANFRISAHAYDTVVQEIVKHRQLIENYIKYAPEFLSSLTPLPSPHDAPEIIKRMSAASEKAGVGPMAAVAGTIAQMAAESALLKGIKDVIVENGGDIYLASNETIIIGIYAGKTPFSGKLAFCITPHMMPLALCSSSGTMGHSLSLGTCDLATVVASEAALADAAATKACNNVFHPDDISVTLESIMNIKDISGVLIIKNDKVGMAGELPEIISHNDSRFIDKVTRDKDVWKL